MDENKEIKIVYHITLKDGKNRVYEVRINSETLDLIEPQVTPTKWTELEHCKCDHCPLAKKDFPYCPVAKNLAVIADEYKEWKSYETVFAEVITPTRTYSKNLSLQEALYSVFGLIMPATKCPHLKFLRPMARFHLPFSTFQETVVRSTSLYLLTQFFIAKEGAEPDFELKKLDEHYAKVQKVNMGIISRIRSIATGDADANSITILNGFAQLLSMQLSDGLSEIQEIFTESAK